MQQQVSCMRAFPGLQRAVVMGMGSMSTSKPMGPKVSLSHGYQPEPWPAQVTHMCVCMITNTVVYSCMITNMVVFRA